MFESPYYYEMQAEVYRSMMQAEAERARMLAPLHCPRRVIGYLFLAQIGVVLVRLGLAVERIAKARTQQISSQLMDQKGMASRLP